MQDYRTSLDFQRQIINQRRKEREMQKQKEEEEKLQQEEEQQATLAAEEQAEGEEADIDLDDEYIEEDEDELENARRHRRMSATERFGMTILLGLFGLVGILALDVSGVPVVRIAKRTVYRMLRPRSPMSSDPFKDRGETESGGYEDNVVVIPRGD